VDKILGFLPDADPSVAGVLTDCTNLIPFDQGMRGAPSAATPSGVPALAATCKGAAVVTKAPILSCMSYLVAHGQTYPRAVTQALVTSVGLLPNLATTQSQATR
jgi:hypothetical protein